MRPTAAHSRLDTAPGCHGQCRGCRGGGQPVDSRLGRQSCTGSSAPHLPPVRLGRARLPTACPPPLGQAVAAIIEPQHASLPDLNLAVEACSLPTAAGTTPAELTPLTTARIGDDEIGLLFSVGMIGPASGVSYRHDIADGIALCIAGKLPRRSLLRCGNPSAPLVAPSNPLRRFAHLKSTPCTATMGP